MAKKLTANQQEYKKRIKNIRKYLSKVRGEGYDVSQFDLPKQPSKITKSFLQKLKKFTPSYFRKTFEKTNTLVKKCTPITLQPVSQPVSQSVSQPVIEIAPQEIEQTKYVEPITDYDTNEYYDTSEFDYRYGTYDEKDVEEVAPLPIEPTTETPIWEQQGLTEEQYNFEMNLTSYKVIPPLDTVQYFDKDGNIIGYSVSLEADAPVIDRDGNLLGINRDLVDVRDVQENGYIDMTEQAIQAIYDDIDAFPADLSSMLKNVLQSVEDKIGEQGLYNAMIIDNGKGNLYSAISDAHISGNYKEALSHWVNDLLSRLPMDANEKQAIMAEADEALTQMYGADDV